MSDSKLQFAERIDLSTSQREVGNWDGVDVQTEEVRQSGDTDRFLSHGAIQFIHAPSSRFLFVVVTFLAALAVICVFVAHFASIDISINASGIIDLDKGVRSITSNVSGSVVEVFKRVQDSVKKGEAIARVELDNPLLRNESQGSVNQALIIAPETGEIAKLSIKPFSELKEGDMIGQMFPKGGKFVVTLFIPARDIPNVKLHQKVLYNLESYPYQRFGLLSGEVISISQLNSGHGETSPNNLGSATFEVQSTIDRTSYEGKELRLMVGMNLSGAIITGKDTIQHLIMDKLSGSLQ